MIGQLAHVSTCSLAGLLAVVGVFLLVGGWNVVAGAIFTFVGAVVLLAGWLFSWSRRGSSSR